MKPEASLENSTSQLCQILSSEFTSYLTVANMEVPFVRYILSNADKLF